ncbi:MAG: cupin domain-containing protein, partial [Acidimicrobiia bacterium]|nr:cupin domain-containing protein [Acidimicrobiia bacterium]
MTAPVPPFPGAVGVSHLRVYDTAAPDGLAGGTPHLHTVCTEAYAVVAGSGAVQTLTASGYREVPLEPGAFVWFTPGTIHRLVNHGDLEILVLMANAGLPEAGDMVLTLPLAVLADPEAYAAAAVLPADDSTTAGPGDAARQRRDLAVPAFLDLVAATG